MPVGASIWGPIAVAAVGGYLANRNKQTAQPQVTPQYAGLQGQILQQIQSRLNQPVDLRGYEASGVGMINKTFATQKQTSDNNLEARGLATSPVAANVDVTRQNAEGTDVANFRNSIPLLAQQIQTQNLDEANRILAGGTGSASTTETGGGPAGAATNLAGMLGYLKGKGAFAGGSPGGASPPGGTGFYGGVGSGEDGY